MKEHIKKSSYDWEKPKDLLAALGAANFFPPSIIGLSRAGEKPNTTPAIKTIINSVCKKKIRKICTKKCFLKKKNYHSLRKYSLPLSFLLDSTHMANLFTSVLISMMGQPFYRLLMQYYYINTN